MASASATTEVRVTAECRRIRVGSDSNRAAKAALAFRIERNRHKLLLGVFIREHERIDPSGSAAV